jgi:antirestriction protein ArdC
MSTDDLITERILQTLGRGVVPWHQPWTVGIPRNLVSRRRSRGINVWLTASAGFASPYGLTLNQANALGGHMQKGTWGTPVVFWKGLEVENDGEEPHRRR